MRRYARFAFAFMLALLAGPAAVRAAQAPAATSTPAATSLPADAPAPLASATPPSSSGAALPATPKPDSVSVDTTQGYARILFTFAAPTPVTAQVADGVVTIRLGHTVTTNIDTFTENLGPYVSNGRRDQDGLTYRFALKRPVAIHTSSQGAQTAVDLVPDSFKGVPPDLPPPPPPPKPDRPDVSKLPVVKLRMGEYSDHTRLVFDWPAPVVYTVYPGQARISVRFEALAKVDFSVLQMRYPAWVKGAGWHLDGDSTVVDFDTDAESAFKDFRDGSKVVIDVMAPKTDASAIARAPAPATPKPNPPPKGSDAAAALKNGAAAAVVPAPALPMPEPAQMANPSAELTRDGAALHFPAARGRASAIFLRGGVLWIVLDAHPALDSATLLAPISSILVRAQTEQTAGALVLKLTFKSPLLPSVGESEAALDIRLTTGAMAPLSPITLTRQGTDGQTTLTTLLPGAVLVFKLAAAQP